MMNAVLVRFSAADPCDEYQSAQRRHADDGSKADGSRDAERSTRDQQRQYATGNAERKHGHDGQSVANGVKGYVEETENNPDGNGNDDGKAPLFPAQAVIFASPLIVITLGRADRRRKFPLDLGYGSGKVPPAHAELDGNVAAPVFAVDHERSLAKANVGNLGERHLATIGRGQQNVPHLINIFAVLRLVAHNEIKTAVAFKDLRSGGSADCCLNGSVDVGSHQAI